MRHIDGLSPTICGLYVFFQRHKHQEARFISQAENSSCHKHRNIFLSTLTPQNEADIWAA